VADATVIPGGRTKYFGVYRPVCIQTGAWPRHSALFPGETLVAGVRLEGITASAAALPGYR